MIESAGGVIERLFECLIANELAGYGALVSPDVERVGPWGDRMVGRDRLLELMAEGSGTTWDLHRIVYAPGGQSAFARVTAYPARGGLSQFEQTLAFVMDREGLVSLIEVFWQTPWAAPPGLGSTTTGDG
jgi:SnoaL-like domain